MRKLAERGETLPEFAAVLDQPMMARQLGEENFWQLLLSASKSVAIEDFPSTAGSGADACFGGAGATGSCHGGVEFPQAACVQPRATNVPARAASG